MSETSHINPDQAAESSHLADARADVIRRARHLIRSYVDADAMPLVYAAHGEQPYDGNDLEGKLVHAEKFGGRYLDVRQGKPRSREAVRLGAVQERSLMLLGEEVGMLGAQSMLGANVHVVLMHGTYREGLLSRVELAKQHVDWHQQTYNYIPRKILGLSIERPLTDEDARAKIMYAPLADTERQLMDVAIQRVFGVRSMNNPQQPRGSMASFGLAGRDNNSILSLSAPRVEGRNLPNTADTQRYAAEVLRLDDAPYGGLRVLGTTASVYGGFQQLDLMRTWGLPYGADINMATYFDPTWTRPSHIGQEVNSVFDQGTLMLDAIKTYEAQMPRSENITIDLGDGR